MSNLQLALPGVFADASVEWVWRDDFDEVTDVKRFEHATVMRDEVVRAIAPRANGVYVDATLGAGGHTVALLEAEPKARIVALDRDPAAIAAARERLALVADRVTVVQAPFSSLRDQLAALGLSRVDGLVADLGGSSPQLENPERGMSFRRDGPLRLLVEPRSRPTAPLVFEQLSGHQMADVLYLYRHA